jgi:hypothetical protein
MLKTEETDASEAMAKKMKITPKEKGYYTVYASLYDHNRRIGRESDTIWVEK